MIRTSDVAAEVHATALAAHDAGLCVLPVKQDGSKAPDVASWRDFQTTRPNRQTVLQWFTDGRRTGLGYLTGAVSGNLELLDFDDVATYEEYCDLAEAAGLGPLLDRVRDGYLETSPGGVHLLYRCPEIAGNTKLARRKGEDGAIQVLIETRGEGGYVVAAPSNGHVHPTGGRYQLRHGGVERIATISVEERTALHRLARSLDAMPKAEPRTQAGAGAAEGRGKPGEDYNQRGDVLALLEAHNWAIVFEHHGQHHLRRPGKDIGTSATFSTVNGKRYFYVFTTSTVFESERAYSPFGAYATLEHNGDFGAAAKALAEQGYGDPPASRDRSARSAEAAQGETVSDGPAEAAESAPRFPLEVLPPAVAVYVDDAARSLSCPPEMVAVPLLALAGSLIGNRLHLELKNSWREYPTLYVAVVAPPGSAKTPALSAAQWPLDALQDDEERKHRIRREDYEGKLETWKQERSGEKPTPPIMRHYFSTNLTLEALVAMLAHSPGIAIVRDEILGWVQSMDEYKAKGSDRQEYLSLWSCRTIKADRKGSEPIYRRFPVACVIGGIQPDLVGGLHNAAKQRDGFVERLLPIVPDCAPAPWNDDAISPERYLDVLAVFRELDMALETESRSVGAPSSSGADALGARRIVGQSVAMSSAARALWVGWFNDNTRLIADANGGLVAGFYSKLPTQVARLALILHALRNPETPDLLLAPTTMEDAIALGEFFRAHLKRFLALLGTTAPDQSAGIATRILRILRISERDTDDRWVRRSEILNGLRNVPASELTPVLEVLKAGGKVESRTTTGATKPTEQWRLLQASPPFGYSEYSENPSSTGEKSEYSEYPNGESRFDPGNAEAEWQEVAAV